MAAGRPNTLTADMVREGVVVIDVGTNRIDDATRKRGWRLVGDVDFTALSEKASWITPVPGGVGPDDPRDAAREHGAGGGSRANLDLLDHQPRDAIEVLPVSRQERLAMTQRDPRDEGVPGRETQALAAQDAIDLGGLGRRPNVQREDECALDEI